MMVETYPIRSLVYISNARAGLSSDDLDVIYHASMNFNALDGVTGLLVYNGAHFMQIIEGADEAIEDLLGRLRRDPRHHDIQVFADQPVDAESFPDWSMKLLEVSAGRFQAHKDLQVLLPSDLDPSIRTKLLEVLSLISH